MTKTIKIYQPEEHIKGWGREIWIDNNEKYCGKILEFKKGAKFSMHYHLIKEETFYILQGSVCLTYYNLENAQEVGAILQIGSSIRIPSGVPHQIAALEDSLIVEVSTHHEDSDSYRIKPGDSQTCNK